MSTSSRKRVTGRGAAKTKTKSKSKSVSSKRDFGPLALFVVVIVVVLGVIQLATTIYSYSQSLTELNGLKRQESQLIAKKANLENDISRWNDKAYVTAQARQRLGFVFPGEQSIHVEHPEAVTGVKPKNDTKTPSADQSSRTLPWYSELAYGFKKADEPLPSQQKGTVTAPGQQGDNANGGQKQDAKDQPDSGNGQSKSGSQKTTSGSGY